MRLNRFFNFACAFVLLATLVVAPAASLASDTASVATTILDSKDQPVSGARVVFTGSAGTTFSTHTDKHGLATINLPIDTYTIVASRNGYSSESLGGMNIAANTTLSMTIASAPAPNPATNAVPAMHQSAGVVPARTVAAAPAPVNAQPAAPPPLVHDALLATYNAHQPEHARGEPYYGRYTYVLLAGTGPGDPRNRALVAALVAKYGVAANGGKQTVIGNPFGYNIFFMPVTGSGKEAAAGSVTTDALLAAYDYKTARYLHDRYCAAGNHAGNPICTKPLAQGPFMLTLTRPLEGLRARDAFPPAFAYDFSGVAPDQYAAAVTIVARTTSVPEPMQADLELPVADLTKYVGPVLVATSDQMHRMVPSAKVYVDTALAAFAN
jgi:hypothetical protein